MTTELIELRKRLVEKSKKAGAESVIAKITYAQPHSGHDAAVRFFESRGAWSGIGSAIEELDDLLAELDV